MLGVWCWLMIVRTLLFLANEFQKLKKKKEISVYVFFFSHTSASPENNVIACGKVPSGSFCTTIIGFSSKSSLLFRCFSTNQNTRLRSDILLLLVFLFCL